MTVTYPLRIFFDCSTVNLSAATRRWLDENAVEAATRQLAPIGAPSATPFGWFLYAAGPPYRNEPPDLISVIRHARAQGAEYILFDVDAPPNDALPVFVGADRRRDAATTLFAPKPSPTPGFTVSGGCDSGLFCQSSCMFDVGTAENAVRAIESSGDKPWRSSTKRAPISASTSRMISKPVRGRSALARRSIRPLGDEPIL